MWIFSYKLIVCYFKMEIGSNTQSHYNIIGSKHHCIKYRLLCEIFTMELKNTNNIISIDKNSLPRFILVKNNFIMTTMFVT